MLQLCWIDSNKPPIWLVDEKYTIGSDPQSDFVVGAPGVESHSLDIVVKGESLSLVRQSTMVKMDVNGTPVVNEAALMHGDTIHVGSAALQVVDPKQIQKNAEVGEDDEGGVKWALQAQNAALSHRVFALRGSMILGRSKDCDICLSVSHLSRQHAKLTLTDEGLQIEDLNSSNGTYVNGKKISKVALKAGDELSFDALTFRVTCSEEDSDKTSLRPALNETEFPSRAVPQQKNNRQKLRPSIGASSVKEEPLQKSRIDKEHQRNQWIVLAVVGVVLLGLSWFLFV